MMFNGSHGKIHLNDDLLAGPKLQSDVTIILTSSKFFEVFLLQILSRNLDRSLFTQRTLTGSG